MSNQKINNATALSPTHSVVVEACAGSGKTWLLVSRMIRLLLAGAKPSELLAITFTRKAAQEMTARLYEWLEFLATEDDAKVQDFLRQRQLSEHEIDALMPRTHGLLEAVLTAQPGPAISTFHAWFLELLRHAPLEAGLPWGAPLLDREKQLRDEVLDRLLSEWAAAPESEAGRALLVLLDEIGESNLKALLHQFIQSRAEWLASTEGQDQPVESMLASLRALLSAHLEEDAEAAFWADDLLVQRARNIALGLELGTATELRQAAAIRQATEEQDLAGLRKQILDSKGNRPKKKANDSTLKKLAGRADNYLRDYDALETALENVAEQQSEQRIWSLNRHGLLLGNAFLQTFQQAKAERGVLDYADAEWLGCQLLESEEFAPAINLKLDARIRHLLLDEFQDTNPLQWRALSAWLLESRAADSAMTVFMVGDPKQAIYRFRRGEARVFDVAADFLQSHFSAARFSNDETRRLAPAVVQAVNPVFEHRNSFAPHTWPVDNDALAGAVRFVPALTPPAEKRDDEREDSGTLRDPLTDALPEAEDKAVHEEARMFAHVLKNEVLGQWAVQTTHGEHAARNGDVMALVRNRTHLKIYEQALEAEGIPFITSRRGGLLHALEAQDIIALLEVLLLPHADLKLAHVLKSPLFGCSDQELLQVFDSSTAHGWERLQNIAANADCPHNLARAARLLSGWKPWAGLLPAHDLLDRMYFECDVEARYAAAAPQAMRPQIAANLRAFLQLALTQDAGRYPSLGGFIRDLKSLLDDPEAAPEEGIAADGENAVRLLTIHGAKGLEAPIVWLLGGNYQKKGSHHAVLSPWPPADKRPVHFSLFGKKEDQGKFREHWFAEEAQLSEKEETNLLYVALTRARQALIVSGNADPDKKTGDIKHPWLRDIAAAWQNLAAPASLPLAATPATPDVVSPAPILTPMPVGTRLARSAQSHAGAVGELFHACLEHLAPPGAARNPADIASRLKLDANTLDRTLQAAKALLKQPVLEQFFNPSRYLRAQNEMELLLADGSLRRIDRMVEFGHEIWVLDYKTGEADAALEASELIARHRDQLEEYAGAARALWPGKAVRAGLVLASGKLISL